VHHAACAVLRVTGHGTSAYAGFHGKRLFTEAEWLHVVINGNTVPTNLPVPSPVLLYQANEFGIRALNSNIGEWGLRIDEAATGESSDAMYVVLGTAG
jgi:formylglycine-generating enzyme required for sulfatase activity